MNPTSTPPRWQGALESALGEGLRSFLPGQRWFGAKARRITGARVEDCVWLREDDEPVALTVVRVEYATGEADRYALLVALRRDRGGLPEIATVHLGGEVRHVVEACGRAADAATLLRGLERDHQAIGVHGGTLRFGDLPPDGRRALRGSELHEDSIRPLGAEQSNTSIRTGTGHVFKLFRRLEAGENPELEMGRFLSNRTTFRALPALRGSVSWQAAGGSACTVGVLQDQIENQGDGWQWVLERLADVFSGSSGPAPLTDAMLTLGAVTADMHAALASRPGDPGFALQPVSADDRRAWKLAFETRAERVFGLLADGREGVDDATRAVCERVGRLQPRLAHAAELPSVAGHGGFMKIRVHGDYHLGQTLRTGTGFVVIDFEGEPARPLAERRETQCALKDVSGMLRSFDYAIESARAAAGGEVTPSIASPPLREAFLRGYDVRILERAAPILPAAPDARERWLRFFELDKALYELEYEFQNRPAWLHIPAQGMIRLIEEHAS